MKYKVGYTFSKNWYKVGYVFETSMARPRPKSGQVHPPGVLDGNLLLHPNLSTRRLFLLSVLCSIVTMSVA